MAMSICWHIWKARNGLVFNNTSLSPDKILKQVEHLYKDFINISQSRPNKKNAEGSKAVYTGKWLKTPPRFLKINIDPYFKADSYWDGGRVLTRDKNGEMADVWYAKLKASTPLMSEAMALRTAYFRARDKNWERVIFESDSQVLVNLCEKMDSLSPWKMESVVDDIRDLKANKVWSFAWIPREADAPANYKAKFARKNDVSSYICCKPHQLWSLVAFDNL